MKTLFARFDFSYIYAFLGEATLGLTLVFFIALARVLGPDQYGIWAAAAALAGILSFFIQFGLPNLLTREVSADPQRGAKSTAQFLLIEGLSALLVLFVLLPLAQTLGFQGNGIVVCYLAVLAEVCRSAKQTLRGVFRGMGWFRTESISVALERFFAVAIAGVVLFATQDLILVIGTLVLVRTADIIVLLCFLSRKVRIWSPISVSSIRKSVLVAYPFALSGVLWVIYYQIDLVMLKGLTTPEQAGFYSAAYRTLEIFSALPRVIFAVAFTRFARCYATDPARLPREIYKSTQLLLVSVLPALCIAGFLQPFLIQMLYGEAFTPALKPLAILLPSLGVKMFATMATQFLQASGREKCLPSLLLGATAVNIVCNFVLIPFWGTTGAALATLVGELVLCLAGMRAMNRIGYQQEAQSIALIALVCLLVAGLPSLILNGLVPIVGIGLMVIGVGAIGVMMRRDRFLPQSM
ncbi:MAG: flippase [Cyanobacteria bacterium J06636_16]